MFQTPWSVRLDADPDIDLGSCVLSTTKLQATTSPFLLYPYVEWICNMPSGFAESGYLNVGTTYTFTFSKPDGSQVSRQFGILDIDILPIQSALTLSTTVKLTLTVPTYFKQRVSSKAYAGLGSEILTQVYSEDFPDTLIDVELTAEANPHKLYRTYQTPFAFIQDRLLPYCIGANNGAYFIYSTLDGSLHGRGYQSIVTDRTSAIISDVAHSGTMISRRRAYPRFIPAHSLQLTTKNYLWNLIYQPMYHMIRHDYSVKTADKIPYVNPFTRTNISDNRFGLIHPDKNQYQSRAIVDDSLNFYVNVYSRITQETIKELLLAQTISVVCDMDIDTDVGESCQVIFDDQKDSKASIFSGTFMILEATKMFQGTKSWMNLILSVPGFTYTDEAKVLNFLHTIKS